MNAIADGLKLREILKLKNLKPPQLAELINVNRSQVNHWMNDISISDANKQKITQATGIEFDTVAVPFGSTTSPGWFSMSPASRSVAILIFLALALLGFYFWFQAFSVPGSISQTEYPEKFAAFYKTLPQWMLKEKQTSYALWTQLSEKQQAQLPGALKNYTDYEMRQAASRGQTTLTEGYVCKDKNFLKPGGHACGFENYIEPISIVGGVE